MDQDRMEQSENESFSAEVIHKLKTYVYRLIDPRNGETFYVGKGQGNRIFQHARAALNPGKDEDAEDLKFKRINNILAAGLNIVQVIHRHNIERERVALEIEAALIDAYPGLANKNLGIGADYGCRHVEETISQYSAEPFEAQEPLILISQRTKGIEELGAY